jgi:hypothetical protein
MGGFRTHGFGRFVEGAGEGLQQEFIGVRHAFHHITPPREAMGTTIFGTVATGRPGCREFAEATGKQASSL